MRNEDVGCSIAIIVILVVLGTVIWMAKDVIFGIGYH